MLFHLPHPIGRACSEWDILSANVIITKLREKGIVRALGDSKDLVQLNCTTTLHRLHRIELGVASGRILWGIAAH